MGPSAKVTVPPETVLGVVVVPPQAATKSAATVATPAIRQNDNRMSVLCTECALLS